MVNEQQEIKNIELYAKENNIPIMEKEGINFLLQFIKDHNIEKILELGTAIGYSSSLMALTNKNIKITTIERDEQRYQEATKNIKKLHLESQITQIKGDAFNIELTDHYDMIFIDAAKAQNKKFFLKFQNNLTDKGYIITDNLFFHGLVNKDLEEIESKNLRALVRKIKDYHEFLKNNKDYQTDFYQIGDGISISYKKEVD